MEPIVTLIGALIAAVAATAAGLTASLLRRDVRRFERATFPTYIRPVGLPWPEASIIDQLIVNAAERHRVELTEGARAVLSWPAMEAARFNGRFSAEQLESSLDLIMATIAQDPDSRDAEPYFEFTRRRTSLSVLKAVYRRFCNIPPFCKRTDEEGSDRRGQ